MCNRYKKIQWTEVEVRLEIRQLWSNTVITQARGRFVLAWMFQLEPGYLPGRDALVQPCMSWITLHTDGKNKLKNGVLDLFTHWAAFPCVPELTAKPVISPLKDSSCSGLCTILKLFNCNAEVWVYAP